MKPARSEAHLKFIRSLPCVACALIGRLNDKRIEAAHAPGSRGMGQKRSDFDTLPLCRLHHDEQHRVGWLRFMNGYGLDVQWWLCEIRAKPRLESFKGYWNLVYAGGYYRVGGVGEPLTAIVLRARSVFRQALIDNAFEKAVKDAA